MNGAESLIRTLVGAGVDVCFANPGTSEMHMVQAVDRVERMRPILALFEGVCTGAADGYARMTGKPAVTMLHLGPGLANGIANLHNARRARSPIINLIGNHASYHVQYDAPLTSDIDTLARNVSCWIKSDSTSTSLARDGADALTRTLTPSKGSLGQIVTMSIPAEASWGQSDGPVRANSLPVREAVDDDLVKEIAISLDSDTVMLIDSTGMSEAGAIAANRIMQRTGCKVMGTLFSARIDGGPGRPKMTRLPYFPEHIMAVLKGTKKIVLAGAQPPTSFFAYPDTPSLLMPDDCEVRVLAGPEQDIVAALESLADHIGADADGWARNHHLRPDLPQGVLSVMTASMILANLMPDNSIICGDSGGGGAAFEPCQTAAPHSWLNITGGSIGQGGPVAVGAAIAHPDRQVFALLGDGAAMYTIQALWTQARENLNVITVIYSNRIYGILNTEYLRLGVNEVGQRAASLFDLGNPTIDFVQMAGSMGVPGQRATTCEEFVQALGHALASDGPYLIELLV